MNYLLSLTTEASNLRPSATLAINQLAKAMRAKGEEVFHLGFGESPFPVPEIMLDALRLGGREKSYQHTQGMPSLRDLVARYCSQMMGVQYDENQVIIGPGSKDLIFKIFQLLDGDLLIPVPSWVSYIPQAQFCGKNVVRIQTRFEDNYCLQVADLEQAYKQASANGHNPRLLLINSPGNPCGNVYPEELVMNIGKFARENKLIIISDEIYSEIVFSGYKHVSFAKYYPEGTIVTSGISKIWSLGGWRLGVCLIPKSSDEFLNAFNCLISETFSCASAPIQIAAESCYDTGRKGSMMTFFRERCRQIHQEVLRVFYKELSLIDGVICNPPQGGFYLYMGLPTFDLGELIERDRTSEGVALKLLREFNVATLPGTAFGEDPSRINLRLAVTDYNGGEALDYFFRNNLGFLGFEQNGFEDDDFKKLFPNLVGGLRKIQAFAGSYCK